MKYIIRNKFLKQIYIGETESGIRRYVIIK